MSVGPLYQVKVVCLFQSVILEGRCEVEAISYPVHLCLWNLKILRRGCVFCSCRLNSFDLHLSISSFDNFNEKVSPC